MSDVEKYRKSLEGNAAKAFEAGLKQTQLELASGLMENRGAIAEVLDIDLQKNPEQLDSKQITRMAGEYLRQEKISVQSEDGKTLRTLSRAELMSAAKDVQSKASGFAADSPALASALGFGDVASMDLEENLPENKLLALPAKRISEAVSENEGWMSQIMFAIQGFLKWVMSGFEGGLMESIHSVAADSVANSAQAKIAQDIANPKNKGLSEAIGGKAGLADLREQVYQNTLDSLNNGDKAKPQLTDKDIAAQIEKIDPLPLGADPAKWTDKEVAAVEQEQKDNISEIVENNIEGAFDVSKNPDEWKKVAADGLKEAGWGTNTLAFFTSEEYEANVASKTAYDAVNGADKTGIGKVGDAVAEGLLDTVKGLDETERNALIANPKSNANRFGKDVAEAAFKTDEWKQVEANIRSQDPDDMSVEAQTKLINTMKEKIQEQLPEMIKARSADIKSAEPMKELVGQIVDRARDHDAKLVMVGLDRNKDGALDIDELSGKHNSNSDKKLDGNEYKTLIAAMPDAQREAFDRILANKENASMVERDKTTNEIVGIDFSKSAPPTPGGPIEPAGLKI